MTNKKAKEVIERLNKEERENRNSIRILGNEENIENAFSIIMHSYNPFSASKNNEYHCISKKILGLLREAEIEFAII